MDQLRQQQPGSPSPPEARFPGGGAQERAQRGRARTPPNNTGIAPCRSRSMSSMLSAPAIIPAARQPTFSGAFTPHRRPIRTCSPPDPADSPAAPGPSPGPGPPGTRDSGHQTSHRSSPGHATIALARCPLQLDDGSFSNSHRPSSEGTFRIDTPRRTPIYAVD